jgi:hypothetical protein
MRTIIDECDHCGKMEICKTYSGYIDPSHMTSIRMKEYCNDCIDRMVSGFNGYIGKNNKKKMQ